MEKIEQLLEQIPDIKSAELTIKPDKRKIPVSLLIPTVENVELFNNILLECINNNFNLLETTESGTFSTKNIRFPAYFVSYSNVCVELVIFHNKIYRLFFRAELVKDENNKQYTGKKAFENFKKHLLKFNINLDDYKIENGKDIKKEIEKPFINLKRASYKDLIFKNVHHIDYHSSYPAGLANTHPEFKSAINDLYENRKTDPLKKATLNYSIGFMQSRWCNYKWAHLSRDAINDNNKRIKELSNKIESTGRVVLLYNTDGIWYTGPIYHGEGEGKNLGDWENDHINCILRIKSKGAYEFIEDEKYYPVIRGLTTLDKIKPRTQWEWGDIYKADIIKFYVNEEGFIEYKKED